jgi:hypothetical protein
MRSASRHAVKPFVGAVRPGGRFVGSCCDRRANRGPMAVAAPSPRGRLGVPSGITRGGDTPAVRFDLGCGCPRQRQGNPSGQLEPSDVQAQKSLLGLHFGPMSPSFPSAPIHASEMAHLEPVVRSSRRPCTRNTGLT